MKLIIWGINYYPELTGIAPYNRALAKYAAQQGYEVEMVTTFSYYPEWKKRPEDKGKLFETSEQEGVRIHRCWHYVPQRVSPLKRIFHEATFVTTSFLKLLTLPKPNLIVVISPPLLLGAAAWLLTRFKRCPFVFHVQDMQPDAAVGLGMVKKGWLVRALYGLESFAYAKAARVSGISHGMLDAFRKKGVPSEKLIYFPNGARLPKPADIPVKGGFRASRGIAPDEFLVVYSGNLGIKQGIGILAEAAAKVANPKIRFWVSGEGADKERFLQKIKDLGVKNLVLSSLLPDQEYRQMLVDADVCVITQQKGSGACFFPSKLLQTLAYSKPVVSVADTHSELFRAMADGRFGVNVLPDEPEDLAKTLDWLSHDSTSLQAMGAAGREFVAQFEMNKVLAEFMDQLTALHAQWKSEASIIEAKRSPAG